MVVCPYVWLPYMGESLMSVLWASNSESGKIGQHTYIGDTLTHGCLKVHGGVPIVLCICVDPI